jgi:polysaccharide chain length determinant protein (PEP-CTERM system associated)
MVPGKKYTPEDILQMVWRRKWLIVLPFLLVSAGTMVYSRSVPNVYKSETVILIVPQQVPRHFVTPTVTTQIDQRLQAISQQVRSRAKLEQLIQEFDLYPEMRQRALMDDVVARMNLDIMVGIDRSSKSDANAGTTFRVAYESQAPLKAKQVTERLASMFIDANLQDRALLAEGTDQFLEAELEAARKKLEEQERAVEEYRRQHPWDQAEEVENNRWAAVNTQQALQNHLNAVAQGRDRLLFLEKMVADLEAASAEPAALQPSKQSADVPQTAAAQLEAATASLRAMELRLKPEHPDIVNAKRTIKELEKKAEQEALAAPVSGGDAIAQRLSPESRSRLLNMRHDIDNLKRYLAEADVEEQRLRTTLAEMNRRIENLPLRVREMRALTRDYDIIRARYNELLQKKETSRIAVDLERQQIGEQMRVIEPARQPQRPIRPDRSRINLLGAVLGLGLGLGIAALIEYRDTSLRSDDDVLAALSLPVLALVPVLKTPTEIIRAKKRRFILSVTAAVTLVISAAGVLWTLWA